MSLILDVYFLSSERFHTMSLNQWSDGETIICCAERPIGNGHDYFWPRVNYRRVKGFTFTPYVGGSHAWKEAANRMLASEARANFERRGY